MQRPADDDDGGPGSDRGVRGELAATVASAAAAYGYTISLGGSIALAGGELGSPNLGDILLLMLGAVAAFLALEWFAHGTLVPTATAGDHPPSIWGNAHLPAAGSALTLVWLVLRIGDAGALWAVVGFVATVVFFLGTVLQRVALRRLVARRAGGACRAAGRG